MTEVEEWQFAVRNEGCRRAWSTWAKPKRQLWRSEVEKISYDDKIDLTVNMGYTYAN